MRTIGILMMMIQGWPDQISAIKGSDVQCTSDLINDHINGQHSPFMPLYIHQLFANIAQKTKEVQMNLAVMNGDKECANDGYFGYKKLKPLFFIDGMVNFAKLCQIFNMKLQRIVVSNRKMNFRNKYCLESIHLNASFLEQILFGIEEISKNVSLSAVFQKFLIVEPLDSIKEFIESNQSLFAKKGWSLKKTSYCSERLNAKSDNVLSVHSL